MKDISIKDIAEDQRLLYIEKRLGHAPSKTEALLFYPTYDNAFSDGVEWARKNLYASTDDDKLKLAVLALYNAKMYLEDSFNKSKSPDSYMIEEISNIVKSLKELG